MPETKPHIHGIRPYVSASKLVDATGEALTQIKREEGLTWGEVGEAIGKSDDQAAKYGAGMSAMDFTTFLRACQCWNGRFSVAATMMGLSIVPSNAPANHGDIRRGMIGLTLLLAELQTALLDDDLSDHEAVQMDVLVEQADRFLDELKHRIAAAKAATSQRR